MDIDPRRLVVLGEVARLGGVLAAAQALHVTPSAVSQQLTRLEREVGLALTVRVGRGLELTAAGVGLARRGARVAAELSAARADVAALADGVRGRVVVAGFPSGIAAIAVPAVAMIAHDHPGIELRLLEVPERVAAQGLLTGRVDLELLDRDPADTDTVPEGLAEVPVLDDAYVLAMPHGRRPPLTAADLAAAAWIQGPPGSTTHAVLRRFSTAGGWQPSVAHEALEYPAVLAMVAGGLGCALVPRLVVPPGGAHLGVDVVELPGLGHRRIDVRFRSARHEPSRAAAAVLAALQDRARAVAVVPD